MLSATQVPFPNMFLLLNKINEPGSAQVDQTNNESEKKPEHCWGGKCFWKLKLQIRLLYPKSLDAVFTFIQNKKK